jgi:hypothetical protein
VKDEDVHWFSKAGTVPSGSMHEQIRLLARQAWEPALQGRKILRQG